MQYAGFTETRTYNSLLQLTRLQDSYNYAGYNYNTDFEYRYTAGQNNGRIAQAKDWITGEEVSYTYDALNRLIGAATTGPEWGQSYTYDGFGNLRTKTVTKGTATTFSVSIDGATNRMAGVQYDASGNQLATVAQPWNPVYQYDGENRLVGTAGQAYGYDPENRRVWKRPVEGAQTETVYFYGADGALLGSYNWSVYGLTQAATNVYFGGRMLTNRGQTLLADRLGSMRMDFGSGRLSYLPYGEDRQTTAPERMKFATYFRDDTGLDYAQQRYYSSVQGRFLTPDRYAAGTSGAAPQSLNLYAYTENDPVNSNDPTGENEAFMPGPNDMGGAPSSDPCKFLGFLPVPKPLCTMLPILFIPTTPKEEEKKPECFAQLKDRPVNDPKAAKFNAVHTFWWVQDRTGTQYIISGGPTSPNASGIQYLNVSVTPGSDNGSGDNSSAHMDWSSGLSWMNCDRVDTIRSAANDWKNNHNNTVQYHPVGVLGIGGPNSNSAAHYFGVVSGFNPNPPTAAYGWWTPIIFP